MAAPSLNALVAIKAVIEFGAGGAAFISRQGSASRMLPWPSGLPPALEMFLLVWALLHMLLQAYLAVYTLHWEKKARRGGPPGASQRAGLRFPPERRRRQGSIRSRASSCLRVHVCVCAFVVVVGGEEACCGWTASLAFP